jgi:hypothetical protein
LCLEIEDLGFCGHIDKVRPTVESHIVVKFRFIQLAVLGAGSAYSDFHLFFHQVGQVVIGAIAGGCFDAQVPGGIGPHDAAVNEEQIDFVSFGVGDFGELKTPRCCLIVIFAQYKQKISHDLPSPFAIEMMMSQQFRLMPFLK